MLYFHQQNELRAKYMIAMYIYLQEIFILVVNT